MTTRTINVLMLAAALVAFVAGPLQWWLEPMDSPPVAVDDSVLATGQTPGGHHATTAPAAASNTSGTDDRLAIIRREITSLQRTLDRLRDSGADETTRRDTETLLQALQDALGIWDGTRRPGGGTSLVPTRSAEPGAEPLPLDERMRRVLPPVLAAEWLRQMDDAGRERALAAVEAVSRCLTTDESLELALHRLLPAEKGGLQKLVASPLMKDADEQTVARLNATVTRLDELASRDRTPTGLRMAIADGNWERAAAVADYLESRGGASIPAGVVVRDTGVSFHVIPTTDGAINVVPAEGGAAEGFNDWAAFSAAKPSLAAAAKRASRGIDARAHALHEEALGDALRRVELARLLSRLSDLRDHLAIAEAGETRADLLREAADQYDGVADVWQQLIESE